MSNYVEYKPLIKVERNISKYYVVFYSNVVEVNIDVFMQIFGIHKIEDNKKRYFIEYSDEIDRCRIEVSLKEFREFNSFKSKNIKYKNIYDRYFEHSEQSEETIQKHMVKMVEGVEDIVYRNLMREEIEHALISLNEIQKRRFVMYYIDEMTYEEIAKVEGCTKRAIKFSVDASKKNLQKILKNLYLDYTNQ